MTHDNIVQALVANAPDRIRVYGRNAHELHVGITTADGDGCEVGVYIHETRLGMLVTDGGVTWDKLWGDSIVCTTLTLAERRAVARLARAFRIVWDNDRTRLVRRATERDVVDVVHWVAAASIALDAMRFFWVPERVAWRRRLEERRVR